ncbi:MAG TPA: sulfite exporter TauE/SafE family protein [Caulobacteraceae bacterium]|jgi:uncharacterized membrane protein YfcA|nr:sulfite exporter TauE/SafE family protein [Caulobacteraceae bacterium]
MILAVLFLAGLWAGAQNALAGGGSFITLAALILAGVDPRAANITSAVALFPAQVASGVAGRNLLAPSPGLRFRWLVAISLVGGVMGAWLLLATPSAVFARMVPWLVLTATGLFTLGAVVRPKPGASPRIAPFAMGALQFAIAVYGGYFGGGIGFLMMALLALAGYAVRSGSATKNILAAVMNASAVAIFVLSPEVRWLEAAAVGLGAVIGGVAGVYLLRRAPDTLLRALVILIGLVLTVALFVRQS